LSTTRSHKKLKRLLNTDPNICLIKTPAGIYRTHKSWFEQLCALPWLVKVAPRVASVASGFAVIISDKGFHAYKSGREAVGPSLPTFSQQVDQAWIYKVESRSLSPSERDEAATRDYAMFVILEAA